MSCRGMDVSWIHQGDRQVVPFLPIFTTGLTGNPSEGWSAEALGGNGQESPHCFLLLVPGGSRREQSQGVPTTVEVSATPSRALPHALQLAREESMVAEV